MRILVLGDVVGRVGRQAVTTHLPRLVDRWKLDFVVVNGENAAGGFGISEEIAQSLIDAGADAITTGNHVWDQREALVFIERQPRMLRPLNFPPGTPGHGAAMFTARSGQRVLVANIMGRTFMDPLDDPVRPLEAALDVHTLGSEVDAAIVDIHAEATSEKQALGHLLDGRVSLVVGTHTHCPTADHRVLPGGTGYITDLGMCGAYDGVIGMDKDEPMRRFVERTPGQRITPATGPATLCGVAIETDDRTGLALWISAVRLGGDLHEATPSAWA
ncbi:TIGR00282 family metallophosphoesterase [Acuticoccus yangtzensis]|uniref:TIGR00282 family metallophosphoesterase n=1 Tax=Acuticoccus yangtzensis TaxID=1443441 RepID=UPI00094974EC|nr:TIGR00282 family metallophosphoesterase [Acuticoccus yangtzensis]ORE93634.1 metallophosphoesterase [Stappia sp. 22II-S9-Z10]